MLDSIHGPQHDKTQVRTKKRSRFRFWFAIVMLILLAGGIAMGAKLVVIAQKIFDQSGGSISFRKLFLGGDKTLIGEEDGEVRILLLGIGGGNHEGATLTDTIILATLKLPQTKNEELKVSLISIPRDLVAYIPGYDYRKINSAYAYGEADDKNQGSRLTLQTVEKIIGKSIPYYALVDFDGFKKIVDDLGGVEIDVERQFTDSLYPDGKDGYIAPLTFEAGKQKMDGDRALKYVRSRHGNNSEGTDFARSVRQQKILKAVKDKVFSLKVLTNLSTINNLLDDFADHLRTNIQPHEIKRLYDLTKNLNSNNITATPIDVESGIVCNQIEEETGAYLLVPCAGLTNYEAIRNLVKNQFLLVSLGNEKPQLEIQNASLVDFMGKRLENFLKVPYLTVTATDFKGETKYQESVLYDNTGRKPETLKYLRDRLGIRVAASPFPFPTVTDNPDFVIVAAKDLEEKLP